MMNIYPYLEGAQLRALVRFDAEQNDVVEIVVSGPRPVKWTYDVVAGQTLDILLLGPHVDKPGRYDWSISCAEDHALQAGAIYEVAELDLV